jgi:hypothetical protein
MADLPRKNHKVSKHLHSIQNGVVEGPPIARAVGYRLRTERLAVEWQHHPAA